MSIFGRRKKGNRGNGGNQMNRAVVDKIVEITTPVKTDSTIENAIPEVSDIIVYSMENVISSNNTMDIKQGGTGATLQGDVLKMERKINISITYNENLFSADITYTFKDQQVYLQQLNSHDSGDLAKMIETTIQTSFLKNGMITKSATDIIEGR